MSGRTRFRRVFRIGDRTTAGGLTVIAAAGNAGPSAVGIVVKRSIGNAVVRNRAKRRLREAVAEAVPPPGFELVVVAGEEVNEAPFDELVEWLSQAMPKERTT